MQPNGAGQFNGTGQQYGQYGQAQQYGAEAAQEGQSRPGADGQASDQPADYQYGAAQGSAQYGGASGYADAGYRDAGYADARYGDTGFGETMPASPAQQATVQPGGYGGAGQYPAPQQDESAPSYSTGPQPSYGYQPPAGQPSFGDGQPSSQAYGAPGQAGGGQQAGFTYQGTSAPPEESHGDDTGPRPVAHYADQAAYGQPAAQSYDARQQAAPSRDGEPYERAYPGQGYDQQGYQQPGYDDQGYAAHGRAEQVPSGLEFASGSFGNRGYTVPGQQDEGRPSGQYQEYGYGQQADQQEAAAAQARAPQGFAAQPPAAAPQQWQDAARAAQSAAAPGYPAGNGGAATLSAPVPPDHGAGGQPPRGPAPAQSGVPFTGQQGGSYGTPVPEADRYSAS